MVRVFQTAELDPRTKLDQATNDWVYNGLDCAVTLEIADELRSQCDETSRKTYEFSLTLQAPVLEMTLRGLRVNKTKLDIELSRIRNEIDKVEYNLNRILKEGIGVKINWRSPKQLIELFYDIMQLKVIRKRNASGGFSPTVNRDALERLSSNFFAEPIINHILKLRDLKKKCEFLETNLDQDGRMRANWNIAGTNTGRLSSSESDFGTGTNNQNIDRSLREVFIADPRMKIGNIDLEQADARNVGAICWNLFLDEYGPEFAGSYLDACEKGDLHTYVCSLVWPALGWTSDSKRDREIADQMFYRDFSYRDVSKRTGHGSNYLGLVNISRATKIPMSALIDFQEKYFKAFPCIELWHDWVRRTLQDVGFITTLLGRRRFFYGRAKDENTVRAAVAYEPQSMTADQIDKGMLELWRTGTVQLLAQVHDSVLFQYKAEEEATVIPAAIEIMTQRMTLKGGREFVMPVEAKVGWNWGDRKVDKAGLVTNPHGLEKWTGKLDTRKPPTYRSKRQSFFKLLQ